MQKQDEAIESFFNMPCKTGGPGMQPFCKKNDRAPKRMGDMIILAGGVRIGDVNPSSQSHVGSQRKFQMDSVHLPPSFRSKRIGTPKKTLKKDRNPLRKP